MRRREFIALLGGAAAWPFAARAAERRLVGALWSDRAQAESWGPAMRRGLAEAGFAEGSNLALAERYAGYDLTRLAPLAGELAALKPDVIVAAGSRNALEAHRAAPEVPVVAGFDGDPVALGLFQSYPRPGGMVTGLTLVAANTQIGKNVEIMREVVPGLRSIGFMFSPDVPGAVGTEPIIRAAAEHLGLAFAAFPIRSMDEVRAAFLSQSNGVDAMDIYGNPVLRNNVSAFVDLAIAAKKPVMTIFREFTQRGFLVSYGPDLLDMWRRLGGYAGRILAGTKPGDLPVEQPQKFALVINLKTAKALGLEIPPSLLVRADEVIE
ncbi:MAG TPA: ABC transporter substrate-binding protein [Xanthobacteraceae bacterium]|jgi:putative ABC transport system substrate-binding protein|nr:ABC transporter substrate-binding protein [Xanthobacteraceae bacterium]